MFRLFGRGRVLGFGDLPIEVRGWSREVSEVYYEYLPTVSETFTPCPTHRDAYLRRVVGVKAPVNNSLGVGRVLHDAFLTPFRVVSRLDAGSLIEGLAKAKGELLGSVPNDLVNVASVVYDFGARFAIDLRLESYPLPVAIEPELSGNLVGFSDVIKPDLVLGLIPVEVVVSDNQDYITRKEEALAVYAMALEAMWGNPVNYGILVVINPRTASLVTRQVVLTDDIRRAAIRERNEVARIVSRRDDPGPSPRCPQSCPFYDYCRGGGDVPGSK
jgi:CRISPR-associated protein Csa1